MLAVFFYNSQKFFWTFALSFLSLKQMKIPFIFCLVMICGMAQIRAQEDGPLDPLIHLQKVPSKKALEQFKKTCNKNHWLDFDGDTNPADVGHKIVSDGHLLAVRGLVYALNNCTDGASAETLQKMVGDDLALQHPDVLIQALFEEHSHLNLRTLIRQLSDESLSDCGDEKCRAAITAHLERKRAALKNTTVPAAWEPIRQQLLRGLIQ